MIIIINDDDVTDLRTRYARVIYIFRFDTLVIRRIYVNDIATVYTTRPTMG